MLFCSSGMTFATAVFLILTAVVSLSDGQTYDGQLSLFESVLGNNSAYNTRVRPLVDQSQVINVTVSFSLISILTMDDKRQEFITNGFLSLGWKDEIVAWNAFENFQWIMNVYPNDVWRPRLVLLNTLGARDLFEDDYSPTMVYFDGSVSWFPGSLFPASCKLNLKKYPFDKQNCSLQLFAMGWSNEQMRFQTDDEEPGVLLDNYVVNGEWEIVSSNLNIITNWGLAGFQVEFVIQRRSGFFILNIVMPVVLLSFLNIIVFLIPVESGEKISYGITVLLALAVFMSIVSEMLPRSSDVVPLVTVYLFVLLIISVLTVMVAIIIVWLHHKEEEETKRQKATTRFKDVFRKVKILKQATTPLTRVKPLDHLDAEKVEHTSANKLNQGTSLFDAVKKLGNPEKVPPPETPEEMQPRVNNYRLIGRHIDTVAFFLFTFVWLSVTLGFTLVLSS